MAEAEVISASELFSADPYEILSDAGLPRYNRRLADKVLAAFNHAYSIGEDRIARDLWQVLAKAEQAGTGRYARRRPNQALELAASWVAFVDSRNRYRQLSADPEANTADASEAFSAMKNAYMQWLTKLRNS